VAKRRYLKEEEEVDEIDDEEDGDVVDIPVRGVSQRGRPTLRGGRKS